MNTKVHAKDHENYGSFTIISLLIPIVGIIMGAIFLTKKEALEKKFGEHLIVMSVLGWILVGLLFAFV